MPAHARKSYPLHSEASAARTTTANSAEFPLPPEIASVWMAVDATAIGGTPTLVVSLQQQDSNSIWHNVEATTNITAAGQQSLHITSKLLDAGRNARLRWVITGGTPSVTFSASVRGRN